MLQDGGSEELPVKQLCMIAATLLCCSAAHAQTPEPEREVQGTTVTSRDPPIRVTVPKDARYVGADRWPLRGVADCEIHVFVDADADKLIQRLYWIQFEASADFLSEGKISAAWTPVAAGVLQRAKERITFERVSP